MAKVLAFILVLDTLLLRCGRAEGVNLMIDPNWSTFYPGESVTFICNTNDGKDYGWEYEITRNGRQFIQLYSLKSYTLQPIKIYDSGEYQCCGFRRSSTDTKCSGTVSLNVAALPKAKLTAGPTTIPVGGSVTLSSSVEPPAGWKYRWFRKTKNTPEVELTNEENREINATKGGVYRCTGVRGNVNVQSTISDEVEIIITFSNEVIVTRRPASSHISSGETITLTCEVQGGETTEWKYEWRRNGRTVKVGNDKELHVTVSESSGGEYMCQCRRRDDQYSVTKWSEKIPLFVSGTVSSPVSSSLPVLLIVGLIGAIVLIILLLLLWLHRRPNDLFCSRLFSGHSSATSPGVDQTEGQVYSSLLHGTTSVYEMIHPPGATGNESCHHSEEGSVYANVRPGH